MGLQLIESCFSWSVIGYNLPQKSPQILMFCPSGAPEIRLKNVFYVCYIDSQKGMMYLES
ncbi:TPA: hypothetical protein JBI73_05560 [Legionella pneumophila]|nr:hypothetical protein [Legionella pneumophila]HAT8728805.1 hypothetical protein [Legionella pneumophila]HAU1555292.1 hypothetical protein [Legionella pneumophila]HAU1698799.1 hypothetical protein [Legionella pneumophila]HAU2317630.1 hypothetical protein [Legionella pneumophila]